MDSSVVEPMIATTTIAEAWNCDVRTVERGLRRKDIHIVELSPRKRAILKRDYALLLARAKPVPA